MISRTINLCTGCGLEANYPLTLNCGHKICIKCGEKIRESD
jgi:hypothetical protein